MTYDAHKNFAYGLVLTPPNPANSGTTLVLGTGFGNALPATPFNGVVWPVGQQPSTTNAEIVRVTNVSSDSLTITRAQESTSARTIVAGDQFAAAITAKTITDVEAAAAASLQPGNNLSDVANAATARTNLGLGTAATQASSAFDAAGAAAAAQTASLQKTSNLSDVANSDSSRANLTVPTLRHAQCVATTNQALSGALPTIDGYAVQDSDRVLLSAQSTGSQNGPWVAHTAGWARPNDYPSGASLTSRSMKVTGGTVYAGTDWVLVGTSPITIDTSSATWQLTTVVSSQLPASVASVASAYTGGLLGSSKIQTSSRLRDQAKYTAFTVAPTITDDSGTPTIANGALIAASASSVIPATPFRYEWADVTATGTPAGYVGVLSQSIPTRAYGLLQPFCVEFDFDGQAFEALFSSRFSSIGTWRVWANEQVSADQTMPDTNPHYFKIDFGSRAYRRIMIEFDTQMTFGGVYAAITDSVRLPSWKSSGKFAVVGDSYSAGEGVLVNVNNYNARSYAHTMARVLGLVDRRLYGIPGTGFVKTSGASTPTYGTRIADVTGYAPDFIFVQGSLNDNGQAGVQAAVTAYLQALQAALPNAKIVCSGVLTVGATYATTNTQVLAGAAAAGVPTIDPSAYFTGTGKVGATNGSGNADFYQSGSISGHPSPAGHDFAGFQLARDAAPLFGISL